MALGGGCGRGFTIGPIGRLFENVCTWKQHFLVHTCTCMKCHYEGDRIWSGIYIVDQSHTNIIQGSRQCIIHLVQAPSVTLIKGTTTMCKLVPLPYHQVQIQTFSTHCNPNKMASTNLTKCKFISNTAPCVIYQPTDINLLIWLQPDRSRVTVL